MHSREILTLKREEGQSIIMITFILVVLVALMAVVVDVGNAYAQRRIVQNAADSAALAATRELARGQDTTNAAVLAKARSFAQLNGIDPNTVVANYFSFNPDTQQTTDLGVVPNTATRPPTSANGVKVDMDRSFGTYLAQIIGRSSMMASANSSGMVSRGACEAGGGSGLFPIAVDTGLFNNQRDNGKPTFSQNYRIWGDKTAPGNFHWLSWTNDPSNTTLVDNMHDTTRSGKWAVGQSIPGGPGVQNSSNVKAELDALGANSGDLSQMQRVLMPIYDQVSGTGNNTTYRVAGFAWFYVTAYNFQGSDKYIDGYFISDAVGGESEGGCLDAGASTTKLRPPMDLHRTIEGRVAYQYLKIDAPSGQTNYPVDVVQVMDTSGSMDQTWGSGVSKMSTARTVLSTFAGMLRPAIGDQLGLVHFPKVTSLNGSNGYETSSSYYTTCNRQRTSWIFRGEVLKGLTTNVASVQSIINGMGSNGGTPVADAMRLGLNTVTGAGHVAGHPMIIILASDGMTNVTSDNRWTGYSGNDTTGMGGCNGQAETDATNIAMQAKTAGVTVFTIAIGDDFSGTILQAMSSPDTDPAKPHYFVASNPTAMAQIYASLGSRVVNYGGECTITPIETAASGATVRLYLGGSLVATTTASASGSFIFSNVAPGTYTFSATTSREDLTYDVFTAGIGGPQIASPSLVVGQDSGTYSVDLSLKTATRPACAGGV